MQDEYGNLFSHCNTSRPPDGLLDRIVGEIEKQKRRQLKTRSILLGALSFCAFFAVIPAWRELQGELSQTGFPQLVSLLFSDTAIIASYWQDFTFSLLESLPAAGAAAVLTAIFAFLASAKAFTSDILEMRRFPSVQVAHN